FYGVAIRDIVYLDTMRAWDTLARGSGIVSTLTDITVTCTDGIWRAGMYDWEITDGVLVRYCGDAADVTIPKGVTAIGEAAFEGRADITGVTIPSGVTAIGDGAFRDCAKLTGVTIPDGVTAIGENAFAGCDSLTKIDIPQGVTAIGENAFTGCDGLTSADIPASVETIGAGAIPAGTAVTYHGTKTQWETLAANAGLEGLTVFVIDNGTLTGYCGNTASITLPDGVTAIAGGAFAGHEGLKHIVIPAGVTKIGSGAFDRSGITEISYGGTVAEWGALVEAGGIAAEVADITVRCADGTWTPAHRHDWGAYTDGGDGTHRRTCADCGRTESAPHGYDGETYTDAGHTKTCAGCGRSEMAQHTWGDAYTDGGAGGHYQMCTIAECGAHSETKAHQYGDEACTETGHAKTCLLCTYSMTAPHNWSGYTNADTDYHRRTCVPEGFTAHSERVAHTIRYDKGNDSTHTKTCTANCGYSETETHTYGGETYTDTEHSKSCSLCTYSKTAPHSWSGYSDDKDGNHSRTCTAEGFKAHTERTAHTYGTTYTDNGSGKHYQTCSVCHGQSTAVAHTVSYSNGNGSTHTKTCTANCGYSETEAHTYGGETCTDAEHSKTCSLCTYSKTAPHNWSGYTDDKDGNHSRTCTVTGFKTHSETKSHDYGTNYSDNKDGTHYQTCAVCDGTSDPVSHGYEYKDNADGSHTKTCTANCGYSEDIDHNWSGYTSTDTNYHSRTCAVEGFKTHSETEAHDWGANYTDNKDGKHYQTCSVCHGQSTAVAHTIRYDNGNDSDHTKTCTAGCGYSETEEHTWGSETCTDAGHSKSCTLCAYSASKPHDWSDYADDHDGSHHSRTCAIEGFKAHSETKAHEYGTSYSDNKDGKHYQTCSVCHGQSEAVAHDCKHKDNADGTHTITCTKCEYSKTEEHRYKDDTCEDCGCPKPTTVYVARSGSDDNSGLTASKAVKTLSKAIELFEKYGSEKIMLCASYKLPIEESTLLDRAGKSKLTLVRYDGSSDVSDAFTGNLLSIDEGNVTITNVTLDGNKDNVTATGSLLYISGSTTEVTLGNGASLCNNETKRDGGGVYLYIGTFTMTGGTISGCEAENGGGVYTYLSTTFTMSGGTISSNKATYKKGGGVYNQGTFNMSGAAKVESDNDVYLYVNKTICIAGSLMAESPVATITPYAYKENAWLLSAGGGVTIDEDVCGKFAVTPDSSGGAWKIITDKTRGGVLGQ
ncbi:MAG: leucine-rich repeat protein, partial [Treponemataceae bacterium]|nr:leucine-rich repeat protein [Treponemataceae bacterium]